MISRRQFLAALACLPVIGKWMPQESARPCLTIPKLPQLGRPISDQALLNRLMLEKYKRLWIAHRDVDPRDAEFLSGDQWPAEVIAERKRAGLPTL